jgi:hypothetical protein
MQACQQQVELPPRHCLSAASDAFALLFWQSLTVLRPALPRLLLPAAARAVEQTHQILKSIVTQAINEVTELQRFVNLKSEILAHSAVTLDRLKESSEATGAGAAAVA